MDITEEQALDFAISYFPKKMCDLSTRPHVFYDQSSIPGFDKSLIFRLGKVADHSENREDTLEFHFGSRSAMINSYGESIDITDAVNDFLNEKQ